MGSAKCQQLLGQLHFLPCCSESGFAQCGCHGDMVVWTNPPWFRHKIGLEVTRVRSVVSCSRSIPRWSWMWTAKGTAAWDVVVFLILRGAPWGTVLGRCRQEASIRV